MTKQEKETIESICKVFVQMQQIKSQSQESSTPISLVFDSKSLRTFEFFNYFSFVSVFKIIENEK